MNVRMRRLFQNGRDIITFIAKQRQVSGSVAVEDYGRFFLTTCFGCRHSQLLILYKEKKMPK